VLDVAQRLFLADVEGGAEQRQRVEPLIENGVAARAAQLRESGVNVLICGAVSWPLEQALAARGIEVVPYVCGKVDEVLAAYLAGRLMRRDFVMPGCGGCRHRRGRGRGARRAPGRPGGPG
jgi:predicted Fe-Mo cluster-binding NifX family protein